MKRIISIVGIVIGTLIIISNVAPMMIGAILKMQVSNSVGIIGGADGPTAILVIGTLGANNILAGVVIGLVLIIAGILGYRKCKK